MDDVTICPSNSPDYAKGALNERARLRPLLERVVGLFEDGDADATSPSAGMRVGPVVDDLRRELGHQ